MSLSLSSRTTLLNDSSASRGVLSSDGSPRRAVSTISSTVALSVTKMDYVRELHFISFCLCNAGEVNTINSAYRRKPGSVGRSANDLIVGKIDHTATDRGFCNCTKNLLLAIEISLSKENNRLFSDFRIFFTNFQSYQYLVKQ